MEKNFSSSIITKKILSECFRSNGMERFLDISINFLFNGKNIIELVMDDEEKKKFIFSFIDFEISMNGKSLLERFPRDLIFIFLNDEKLCNVVRKRSPSITTVIVNSNVVDKFTIENFIHNVFGMFGHFRRNLMIGHRTEENRTGETLTIVIHENPQDIGYVELVEKLLKRYIDGKTKTFIIRDCTEKCKNSKDVSCHI